MPKKKIEENAELWEKILAEINTILAKEDPSKKEQHAIIEKTSNFFRTD